MDNPWIVESLRLTIPSSPGGEEVALSLFNSSPVAKQLADWLKKFGLIMEPKRAKLFEISESGVFHVPITRTPSVGLFLEDKMSLLGESAYMSFLNDSYSQDHFTSKQLQTLGLLANRQLSHDLAKLVQQGGRVMADSCCCCCCCCSECCCCSAALVYKPDIDVIKSIAMLAFGDHTIDPKNTEKIATYYRGAIGVVKDGGASAAVMKVQNDPKLTVTEITIAMVTKDGKIGTFVVEPDKLQKLGPTALANQLWG